jgi:hypothetical protein
MAERSLNPNQFAPASAIANERIAQQVVQRIADFNASQPVGDRWRAYAVGEVCLALQAASAGVRS